MSAGDELTDEELRAYLHREVPTRAQLERAAARVEAALRAHCGDDADDLCDALDLLRRNAVAGEQARRKAIDAIETRPVKPGPRPPLELVAKLLREHLTREVAAGNVTATRMEDFAGWPPYLRASQIEYLRGDPALEGRADSRLYAWAADRWVHLQLLALLDGFARGYIALPN